MALKLKQRTIETQKIHYQRKKSFLPGSAVDLGSVCQMRKKKKNQNIVLEWGSVNKKPTYLSLLLCPGHVCRI